MDKHWELFKKAARGEKTDQVLLGLIVDSPWIPGYAGIDTLDYYLDENLWFDINMGLRDRFPEAVMIPGFWWEYGMAIEASAFGGHLLFHHDQPPSVEPFSTDLQFWATHIKKQNPETSGLMPLVLRQIERMDHRLEPYGLGQHIACSRGILTVTSWFMGVTTLMESLISDPDTITPILEKVTDTIIDCLDAQLKRMREPDGVMVLDDLVGMISKRQYQKMVEPHFKRIWNHFEGKIRIYHNDTPCEHLYPVFKDAGFDVFNFSHKTEISETRRLIGENIVLLGNVAPRDLGVFGTPDQVYQAAWNCLKQAQDDGKLILSFGGGVSPATPAENIDAMCKAIKEWNFQH